MTPWAPVVVVPGITHISAKALAALRKYRGRLLLAGREACLVRDEYDRPLTRADYPAIELGANEPATADALRQALAPLPFNELLDTATGKPAWGVEFRVVRQGRTTLIALNNFNKDAKTVSLPRWLKESALDLLNGERVSLKDVSLESMSPRLLRLD